MKTYKSHKLRNIDKSVCCKEQVYAYNYLFSWTLNNHDKQEALAYIKAKLQAQDNGTYAELYTPIHPWKRQNVDYDLIYHYIEQS